MQGCSSYHCLDGEIEAQRGFFMTSSFFMAELRFEPKMSDSSVCALSTGLPGGADESMKVTNACDRIGLLLNKNELCDGCDSRSWGT